jgi:hypothetical protein
MADCILCEFFLATIFLETDDQFPKKKPPIPEMRITDHIVALVFENIDDGLSL